MIEYLLHSSLIQLLLFLGGLFWAVVLMGVAWIGLPTGKRLATSTARRVLTNSAVPISAQLVSRGIDLVFAAFALRLLGVDGNGRYALAVIVWLYVKTISDFGLGVLATREVAREPRRAGELLGATTILRWGVLAALLPAVAAYAAVGAHWFAISHDSIAAIVLLCLAVLPGGYADAINAVFNGREQMALPAVLNVLTNLSRAGIGLAALLAGYGVVGLAVASLAATCFSAVAFRLALRHVGIRATWRVEPREARSLITLAWPLLLNGLLVNLFFRADVLVIQASKGDQALGSYDAAYKFINMLLLVPAYFTLAVFPLLSRYAAAGDERLMTSFRLAAKLLAILAWPITLGTMLFAPDLIRILGGQAFLPGSATALRILIWFLPFSYVNGITQYVLIAVDRQRAITGAFFLAVIFNLVANLVLVPPFGYYAAAAITVATELVLFVPLSRTLRDAVGPPAWLSFLGGPMLAAALMGAAELATHRLGVFPAFGAGIVAYTAVLLITGALGTREAEIVREVAGRRRPALP